MLRVLTDLSPAFQLFSMTSFMPSTPLRLPSLSMMGRVLMSRSIMVSIASDSISVSLAVTTGEVMISHTL